MKILVTGACGFICSHLIPELLEAGHAVIGIDNHARYGAVAHAHDRHPHYQFIAADVRDTELLANLAQDCDQMVAGAGLVGRMNSLSELAYDLLAENERINASTFDAAVDACLDGRLARIIVISSTIVYESAPGYPTPEGAERTSPPPRSTYAFQKLATEYFARGAWEQYRLPFTIVRPSSPVGRGNRDALNLESVDAPSKLPTNHDVPDLVIRILSGEDPLRLPGDGSQMRNYVAVRDVARGIRLAMESPEAQNEDFNFGSRKGITIHELAELVWRKIHGPERPFQFVADTDYRHDAPYRVPDVRKAKRVLGFEASATLDEMLDEVIDWVRNITEAGELTAATRA